MLLSPPTVIPKEGVAILVGNSADNDVLFCLWPGDEAVTSSVGRAEWAKFEGIAAQCCTSDRPVTEDCRRAATATDTNIKFNDDCVAGVTTESTFTPMTYGETVAKCSSLGLVLCHQSCAGRGCAYNLHPVYSGLACH